MNYLHDYYAQTPAPGQEFGASRDNGNRTHQGADFSHSTDPGTVEVPIVEGGRVTGNYYSDGYGWRVEIGPWSYSHLEHKSPLVVGATYPSGTIAGTEGDTGSTSGPCMHIEYVQNGRKVDPVPIIRNILGEDDMGVNYPEDYVPLAESIQRAFKFDVRPGGLGTSPELGLSLWDHIQQIHTMVAATKDAVSKITIDSEVDVDELARALKEQGITVVVVQP